MENRAYAPMLPPLPTGRSPAAPVRRLPLWDQLLRPLLLIALCLPLALVGCGGPGQPPRSVLLDALALQIQLTQGSIAQALELEAPGLPQVSRVRVEEQQALTIGQERGLRLSGRFDWRLADDPIRVDSPFELYLTKGDRGQSWRLARPGGVAPWSIGAAAPNAVVPPESALDDRSADQRWITYPLPLPGQRNRA